MMVIVFICPLVAALGFVAGYVLACFHDRPYSQDPTEDGRRFNDKRDGRR